MDHKLRKIVNLHITQNKPYLLPPPPPKKLHTLCFNSTWVLQSSHKKLEKLQKFQKLGDKQGVLWELCKWQIII